MVPISYLELVVLLHVPKAGPEEGSLGIDRRPHVAIGLHFVICRPR